MSAMITCERCGSSVPAGSSVCPNCGAPVNSSAQADEWVQTDALPPASDKETIKLVEEELPKEPPSVQPLPVEERQSPVSQPEISYTPPPPAFQTQTKGSPATPPKKSNPVLWIVGGCVALFLLCCCVSAIGAVLYVYTAR